MHIKVLENTIASGRSLFVDGVYDVSEADARQLINLGRAEAFAGDPANPEGKDDDPKGDPAKGKDGGPKASGK